MPRKEDSFSPFLVSTNWLADHLADPDLRLFDVSQGPVVVGGETISAGQAFEKEHIPGARYLDLKSGFSDPESPFNYMAPATAVLAAAAGAAGIGPDSRVVIYSAGSYGFAARLWWLLRSIGFSNAALLDGGKEFWIGERRSLETGTVAPYPATILQAKPLSGTFVGREDVLAALARNDTVVINNLPANAYSGAAESKNGRRGHITGSVNVPQGDLTDPASKRFLSPEEIRQRFAGAGLTAEKRAITYCGAGVAASVGAFALAYADHSDVAIYDASLAEWACDPSLPMSAPAAPPDPA
ncbi:hypothetical protein ACO34A_22900 (plasmid) [Rhizobium sp. ACO-34A]|nr:rhodanese-like domain-containing protein [Rhizobium sp. ACO-34A]ATN36640.1 hypothetical protein ACO34A_22900 [Rhizobium sp. ACO-34A]